MRAHKLPRKELDQLATRIVRGEIYIANTGEPLTYSFGHLLMMADPLSESQAASIGAVYEERAKASPVGVNGYPFFFSCKFLHSDDLEPLRKRIAKKERSLSGMSFSTRWAERVARLLRFHNSPIAGR